MTVSPGTALPEAAGQGLRVGSTDPDDLCHLRGRRGKIHLLYKSPGLRQNRRRRGNGKGARRRVYPNLGLRNDRGQQVGDLQRVGVLHLHDFSRRCGWGRRGRHVQRCNDRLNAGHERWRSRDDQRVQARLGPDLGLWERTGQHGRQDISFQDS